MNRELNEQEILFCELYATGDAPYAGNAQVCYEEAFHIGQRKPSNGVKALKLLARKDIQEYLEELEKLSYEESRYMKKFLTENLKNIVKECSTGIYRDRRGTVLSPAPLRSVAVNGIKALMEMYPVKEAVESKVNIGADGGSVTFNVIVPEKAKDIEEDED